MPAAKPKPPHEQDVAAATKAAGASQFSAFLFTGVGGRYRREASTFEEAVEAALELEHSYETTRRALRSGSSCTSKSGCSRRRGAFSFFDWRT